MELTLTRGQALRWRAAIFAVFLLGGMTVATWASRVPAIRDALDVNNVEVGSLLLGLGASAIVGVSLSSIILARFGARRSMLGSLIAAAVGMALLGLGTDVFGAFGVVFAGLVAIGFGTGSAEVAMNVEGAAIEKHAGKTLLPLFHAFFSLGTVIGAAGGLLATSIGVAVAPHAFTVAVIILVVALVSIANVPRREVALDEDDPRGWRERMSDSLSAWREPRTYALGVVVLGMAFAEGGANDWMSLAVVDGHGLTEASGAAALAVFSVSMTVVRVFGGPLVDRFGRVALLRVLAVVAATGLLTFILAPSAPFVFVGAALWGIGASLGFPLGMSAAADDPARAAARVSAAATIGYIAFLGGPPILGLISENIGLLNTLLILAVLAAVSGLFASAARPLTAPGSDVAAR